MKITAINLSAEDQNVISNYLISKFNEEDNGQLLDFNLDELPHFTDSYSDLVNVTAKLRLYTDYNELDENNQTSISNRYVSLFDITFFYDGEEITANVDGITEAINKNYEK